MCSCQKQPLMLWHREADSRGDTITAATGSFLCADAGCRPRKEQDVEHLRDIYSEGVPCTQSILMLQHFLNVCFANAKAMVACSEKQMRSVPL